MTWITCRYFPRREESSYLGNKCHYLIRSTFKTSEGGAPEIPPSQPSKVLNCHLQGLCWLPIAELSYKLFHSVLHYLCRIANSISILHMRKCINHLRLRYCRWLVVYSNKGLFPAHIIGLPWGLMTSVFHVLCFSGPKLKKQPLSGTYQSCDRGKDQLWHHKWLLKLLSALDWLKQVTWELYHEG